MLLIPKQLEQSVPSRRTLSSHISFCKRQNKIMGKYRTKIGPNAVYLFHTLVLRYPNTVRTSQKKRGQSICHRYPARCWPVHPPLPPSEWASSFAAAKWWLLRQWPLSLPGRKLGWFPAPVDTPLSSIGHTWTAWFPLQCWLTENNQFRTWNGKTVAKKDIRIFSLLDFDFCIVQIP